MPSGTPVLLVTGGSRGIGAACARLAAKQGYDVAVNYKSDGQAAADVVAQVKAAGRRAIAVQGDMGRETDVMRVSDIVDQELGRLTHLVYNSGITGAASRVEALDASTLREVFDINVFGAFWCTRAAIPRMSSKHGGPGGAIVLVSSMAATLGAGGEYVWYAASKGAIDAMTIGLARELAGENIRVNAVAPGLIDTEIHAPGRLERLTPMVPMGRAGTAQEVADSVLFLLSDAARYVTGTILRVSGGR
jgi:NAD(P)-dependent dehydrogenase (short-subunit alcohol dehydrogenase family)